jgi:hypothetical protein
MVSYESTNISLVWIRYKKKLYRGPNEHGAISFATIIYKNATMLAKSNDVTVTSLPFYKKQKLVTRDRGAGSASDGAFFRSDK